MGLEELFNSEDCQRAGSIAPRRMKTVVVAGTSSGVGKTTIAVGLMAAFSRRGLRVQPFKVGPDFLDPMHHKAATGRESLNLDGWMLSRDWNLSCFMRCKDITDIAIVEGVMGLYDGRDGKSEVGSTAEMAKMLGAPVVLVLDCWALARSAAAMIHGYTTFDKDLKFAGVIFNKVGGPAHTAWLSEAVLATENGVKILGGIPKSANIEIPERHLGLHMPEDDTLPQDYIKRLADLVESHVDLDAILDTAGMSPEDSEKYPLRSTTMPPIVPKQVRIGVARDVAFCFYYNENLAQLQDAGAELIYFSPIEDLLPPSLDGIYFGGGYPELHAMRLSRNKAMLYAVKAFADAGGIVYGECGGLMYLSKGIEGRDGGRYSLCGVFPFWTRMQAAMHMGYVKVRPRESCALFPAEVGEIRGQMYHFSEIVDDNSIDNCSKGLAIRFEHAKAVEELEGYMQGNTLATYVHLHFGSNPAVAHSLVECCRMEPTKAAAIAAASASAVADVGPAAAAAAGAAAAAAVAAALCESIELAPFHSSEMGMYVVEGDSLGQSSGLLENGRHPSLTEGMLPLSPAPNISNMTFKSLSEEQVLKLRKSGVIRRWGSLDLGRNGRSTGVRKSNGRLIKSESALSLEGPIDGKQSIYVARALSFKSENGITDNSSVEGTGTEASTRQTSEGSDVDTCKLIKWRSADYASQQDASPQAGSLVQLLNTDATASPSMCHSMLEKEVFLASRFSGYRDSNNSDDAPQRILSLLPSATEILMDLGVESRLLGVTDLCDKPAGVQNDRHIVCRSKIDTSTMTSKEVEVAMKTFAAKKESPFTLDESWISSIKPDLVLTQDTCEQCDIDSSDVARALARAGLANKENTRVIVLRPHTVSDVLASVLELGRAVGKYENASTQVQRHRSRLRRVVGAVAGRQRPRVMLLQGLDPLCLGGHWVPEMESLAGGQDDLQRPGCCAERLHWPRIISYAPEVLVLAPCSSSLERTLSEVSNLASQPGFWTLPAVESRQLYVCEHSYFSRPSAAIVDGVELLGYIFHPTSGIPLRLRKAAMKLSLSNGQKCKPHELAKHFVAL